MEIKEVGWWVSNMKFHTVNIDNSELSAWIEGEVVKIRLYNAGGSFTGNAKSRKIWPNDEFNYHSFDFHADKGGFKKIEFDFGITKQFVDGKTLP